MNKKILLFLFFILLSVYCVFAEPSININLNSSDFYNLTRNNITCSIMPNETLNSTAINWYKNNISEEKLNLNFDDNTKLLKDYSVYNFTNISLIGTANYTKGYYKNGISFNGINSSINLDGIKVFENATSFSVSFWAYHNSVNIGMYYIYEIAFSRTPLTVYVTPFNQLTARIINNTSVDGSYQINTAINKNVWYFHTLVFNGSESNQSKRLKYYRNGINMPWSITGVAPSVTPIINGALYVGSSPTDSVMNGTIDSFIVYNTALNPQRILMLYQNKTNIISSSELNDGDTWRCEVTPFTDVIGNTKISNTIKLYTAYKDISFISQIPNDISTNNTLGQLVHINYSVTLSDLNSSSVLLYHKSNSSTSDIGYYLNGSKNSGFISKSPSSNVSNNYNFMLYDNDFLYATYNYDEKYIESINKNQTILSGTNDFISMTFYNVSSLKQYSFFEINLKRSSSNVLPTSFYVCNSTYTTGSITGSNYCTLFYSLPTSQGFNHCHLNNLSCHVVVPMAINTSNKKIGNVGISDKMYIMVKGNSENVNISYVNNISRVNTYRITANGGNTYSNLGLSYDAHIHQFDGTDSFYYYVCAKNMVDNITFCSDIRQDLLELGNLYPTSVEIYAPINTYYPDPFYISYSPSLSPNGYAISYKIDLLDTGLNFISNIASTNDIFYYWNNSLIADEYYIIRVNATDTLFQSSYSYSETFFSSGQVKYIIIDNISTQTNQKTNRNINVVAYGYNIFNITSMKVVLYKNGGGYYSVYDTKNIIGNYTNITITNIPDGLYYYKVYAYTSINQTYTKNSVTFWILNDKQLEDLGKNLSDTQLKTLSLLVFLWLGIIALGFYFGQKPFIFLGILIGVILGVVMFTWLYWWIGLAVILTNISMMFYSLKK